MNDVIAKKYWNQEFGDSPQFLNAYFGAMIEENCVCLTSECGLLVALSVFARYEYVFCSQKLSMAYLTGVMTLPAFRNLGYMRQNVTSALNKMNKAGYDICVLIPANAQLAIAYENLGFASVFTTQKPLTLEKTVLHSDKDILLHKRLGYDLNKPYTHGNGMIRIVNPKRIMSHYAHFHSKVSFSFTLKDNLIANNNISYSINCGKISKNKDTYKIISVQELSAFLFKDSYMDCMFDE